MADFRNKIDRLQQEYTEDELIEQFAECTGESPTSYNPLTKAMFREISPDHSPDNFAKRHEDFSDDLNPVEKNALALRLLLHEQIGSPLFDTRGQLTKLDYAECITAIDAYHDGVPREREKHVSTDLPPEANSLVDAPNRSEPAGGDQDPIARFDNDPEQAVLEWLERNPEISDAESYVYVFDCTPPAGDSEPGKVRYQRRVARSKLEGENTYQSLNPIEQAAVTLNEDKSVYYVGMADDVTERIRRHSAGSGHHGIRFTHVYRPRTVLEIEACSSTSEAKALEARRAREYNEEDGIFAYSENM